MPSERTSIVNYYSVAGLFERLRDDAGRYPDTMDQRYGAWAQLLTLFRLVYDGGAPRPTAACRARKGDLFDPDRYPFLEGRPYGVAAQTRTSASTRRSCPTASSSACSKSCSSSTASGSPTARWTWSRSAPSTRR